jgi:hypothetical protein
MAGHLPHPLRVIPDKLRSSADTGSIPEPVRTSVPEWIPGLRCAAPGMTLEETRP